MKITNVLIVSGCMAIQTYKGNILSEELYHNILKDFFLEKYNRTLNFEIVTYYELSLCYKRLVGYFEKKPADLIIFQVRGHYYLQMVNQFTANQTIERSKDPNYIRKKGDIKSKTQHFLDQKLKNENTSINYLFWRLLSLAYNISIHPLGLFIGYLTGKERFAKTTFKNLITDVFTYAKEKNVPVLFLGVVSRPIYNAENLFSRRLNHSAKSWISSLNGMYIDIFGKFTSNNECKFINSREDKLSLNKFGHQEVAEKTAKVLEKILT